VINFPTTPYDRISLQTDGNVLLAGGTLYQLKSIWSQP
jgi:hypothetical protein